MEARSAFACGGLESLLEMNDAAIPTWLSSCITLLVLMSRLSLRTFKSASCCTIVLLHESSEVLLNSFSGSLTATLDSLCLVELLGNLCKTVGFGWANAGVVIVGGGCLPPVCGLAVTSAGGGTWLAAGASAATGGRARGGKASGAGAGEE